LSTSILPPKTRSSTALIAMTTTLLRDVTAVETSSKPVSEYKYFD
jgi:hypothetical protein